MAQYKNAMERIFNKENTTIISKDTPLPTTVGDLENNIIVQNPIVDILIENYDWIMKTLVPTLWVIIFILMMDRDSFISLWYMPILGIFAACLANCVPIGGGIVYVPALSLLGVNMKLGVAFTVTTMTCGNGVFGFLKWLHKDKSLFLFDAVVYTVIPSWIGTLVSVAFTAPNEHFVRLLFGIFCFLMSLYVILLLQFNTFPEVLKYLNGNNSSNENNQKVVHVHPKDISLQNWSIVSLISFIAGFVLVPNIGIGPALTTYISLSCIGVKNDSAIVTGIVVGGWVSLVPAIIHLVYFQDIPFQMWIMVLPGVYIGAQV